MKERRIELQAIILGTILGVVVGLINFNLLIKSSKSVIDKTPKNAGAYVMLRYFIRIILYAAAVIAAVLIDGINAIATGAGIIIVGLAYCVKYSYKGTGQ